MKKTLTVALPGREYQIEIQRGLLDQAGERCRALLPRARKLAVVTDSNVLPLYLERTADSLKRAGFQVLCCSVPAGGGQVSGTAGPAVGKNDGLRYDTH